MSRQIGWIRNILIGPVIPNPVRWAVPKPHLLVLLYILHRTDPVIDEWVKVNATKKGDPFSRNTSAWTRHCCSQNIRCRSRKRSPSPRARALHHLWYAERWFDRRWGRENRDTSPYSMNKDLPNSKKWTWGTQKRNELKWTNCFLKNVLFSWLRKVETSGFELRQGMWSITARINKALQRSPSNKQPAQHWGISSVFRTTSKWRGWD